MAPKDATDDSKLSLPPESRNIRKKLIAREIPGVIPRRLQRMTYGPPRLFEKIEGLSVTEERPKPRTIGRIATIPGVGIDQNIILVKTEHF